MKSNKTKKNQEKAPEIEKFCRQHFIILTWRERDFDCTVTANFHLNILAF